LEIIWIPIRTWVVLILYAGRMTSVKLSLNKIAWTCSHGCVYCRMTQFMLLWPWPWPDNYTWYTKLT